jgi:Uma2 family endonuclease
MRRSGAGGSGAAARGRSLIGFLVARPVLVVEVLSPSTRSVDLSVKLADYFRAPSVVHYLIVDPDPRIIHHARGAGDSIATRVVNAGSISLDPPGFEVAIADIYSA